MRIFILAALLLTACGSGSSGVPSGPTTAPAPTTAPVAPSVAPAPPAPTAPTAPTAPSIGVVGQRMESGGIALTVVGVERKDALNEIQTADAGNVYLVVEVLIEAVDRDMAPYNPLYFSVKTADGVEYTTAIMTDAKSLKSGELPRGEKVRGTVAFEAPAAATGAVLSYAPLVLSAGPPIRVALDS